MNRRMAGIICTSYATATTVHRGNGYFRAAGRCCDCVVRHHLRNEGKSLHATLTCCYLMVRPQTKGFGYFANFLHGGGSSSATYCRPEILSLATPMLLYRSSSRRIELRYLQSKLSKKNSSSGLLKNVAPLNPLFPKWELPRRVRRLTSALVSSGNEVRR